MVTLVSVVCHGFLLIQISVPPGVNRNSVYDSFVLRQYSQRDTNGAALLTLDTHSYFTYAQRIFSSNVDHTSSFHRHYYRQILDHPKEDPLMFHEVHTRITKYQFEALLSNLLLLKFNFLKDHGFHSCAVN